MNKTELAKALALESGLTQAQATNAINCLFDDSGIIPSALQRREKVSITGFGSFEARFRDEREARNPHTGEQITVAARHVPAFKAGKSFKDAVNA